MVAQRRLARPAYFAIDVLSRSFHRWRGGMNGERQAAVLVLFDLVQCIEDRFYRPSVQAEIPE